MSCQTLGASTDNLVPCLEDTVEKWVSTPACEVHGSTNMCSTRTQHAGAARRVAGQRVMRSSGPGVSSSDEVVVATLHLGSSLDGHAGVVHGGILALLIDDVLGFAYESMDVPLAVTANLNVDFRAACPSGSPIRIAVLRVQQEGRKLFWKARVESPDRSILYCEASSVYIIPRAVFEEMMMRSESSSANNS